MGTSCSDNARTYAPQCRPLGGCFKTTPASLDNHCRRGPGRGLCKFLACMSAHIGPTPFEIVEIWPTSGRTDIDCTRARHYNACSTTSTTIGQFGPASTEICLISSKLGPTSTKLAGVDQARSEFAQLRSDFDQTWAPIRPNLANMNPEQTKRGPTSDIVGPIWVNFWPLEKAERSHSRNAY